MKTYSPSSGAKLIGVVMALVPILVSLLFFYAAYDQNSIAPLLVAIPFIGVGIFIIDYSFTNNIIESNSLIFARSILPDSKYNLKDLTEITWFCLPPAQNTMIGGSPQATGRAIGNGLLSIAGASTRNARSGIQFIAKGRNGVSFSLKTNFINNSNELVNDIEKLSGLKCQMISSQEYRAWKSGTLALYRQDPDKKRRELAKKFSPFINVKVLIFTPITLFLLALLLINILFNWAQVHYFETLEKPYSNNFLSVKESPKKQRIMVNGLDVFLEGETKPALQNIIVKEDFCSNESSDYNNQFRYYFFPFQQPYCFNFLMNLDDDEYPEIIYRKEIAKYRYQYHVYDFDTSTKQFISKPLGKFSYLLIFYVDVVTLNVAPSWKYHFKMVFFFLFGYLLLAGIVLYEFNKFKKSIAPKKTMQMD